MIIKLKKSNHEKEVANENLDDIGYFKKNRITLNNAKTEAAFKYEENINGQYKS